MYRSLLFLLIIILLGIIYQYNIKLKEQDILIKQQEESFQEKQKVFKQQEESYQEKLHKLEKDLNDPFIANALAHKEFEKAEIWRKELVEVLYENVTDYELITASVWLSYAQPFDNKRSCTNNYVISEDFIDTFDDMLYNLYTKSQSFQWTDKQKKELMTHHTYHSSGIEGNTLTLPETAIIIDGKELLAGFPDDKISYSTGTSITEVKNLFHALDILGLVDPPINFISSNITNQFLVDINSLLIKDLDTPFGFREHSVAIGFQKVLLPMPDEVPYLMNLYISWLQKELNYLKQEEWNLDTITKIITLSCDAHTRFVHIHPFSDGNGRLARLINGIILKNFGIPLPLFLKEERTKYLSSVSQATINNNYKPLCELNLQAIKRSINLINKLLKEEEKE